MDFEWQSKGALVVHKMLSFGMESSDDPSVYRLCIILCCTERTLEQHLNGAKGVWVRTHFDLCEPVSTLWTGLTLQRIGCG